MYRLPLCFYCDTLKLVSTSYLLSQRGIWGERTFSGYFLPAIVPRLVVHGLQRVLGGVGRGKDAYVPQLDALVLAVGYEVAAVAARVDVRDAVHVAGQDAHGLGVRLVQRPPVPHFNQAVVAAAVNQGVGRFVRVRHTVDVVLMGAYLKQSRDRPE